MSHIIFIAGAGGIGQAAGLILAEMNVLECEIILGEINSDALNTAIDFIKTGCEKNISVTGVLMPAADSNADLDAALDKAHVILDCLPGSQAPRMARLAKKFHCHYANLTEYVAETNEILEISKDADTAFVLQTGIAPGFVNVLAMDLFHKFKEKHGVEVVDDIAMKVGALSQHASPPYYYAFTWSPIGVATEYLKDAVIVKNFKEQAVPALSDIEQLIIDGELYEDNYTSGGAADLPQALAGKVKDLHYKTIRYPGHFGWVNGILKAMDPNENNIDELEKAMLKIIPTVEDDLIILYASVQGKDSNGRLRKIEKSYKIPPARVGTKMLRAIQTTTAAPLCEMAYMMLTKNWKGPVLQSQIPTSEFLNGPFVSRFYGA